MLQPQVMALLDEGHKQIVVSCNKTTVRLARKRASTLPLNLGHLHALLDACTSSNDDLRDAAAFTAVVAEFAHANRLKVV